MKTVLIPRHTTLFPSKETVRKNMSIPKTYSPDHFETYQDWFYFSHIDPVQRWIHAIGMIIGYLLFGYCIYLFITDFGPSFFLWGAIGTFFYYGSGVVSHTLYDGQAGKTTPEHFGDTLGTVHRFNLQTLTGNYDKALREFVKKYPFVIEAHDLVEIKLSELPFYILKRKQLEA